MSTHTLPDTATTDGSSKKHLQFIPSNTLEGLPNELLEMVLTYAVATNEAVNLGPDTMRQDVERIKREALRPFARSPKLLAMAKAEFREEDLIYRLHSDLLTIRENGEGGTLSTPATMDLYFDTDDGLSWIGIDAQRIKHLEVIMPVDFRATPMPPFTTPAVTANHKLFMFAGNRKAFASLESLVVRITTYRMGDRDVSFLDAAGRVCWASNRPDLVAAKLEPRVHNLLATADAYQSSKLRTKEVVFFQKIERHRQEWRNGPLGEPFAELHRSDFESEDLHGLVWQMMDLPSCRLRF